MTKQKLDFKGSCEFYCNYHKVSKTETAMICGNLGIVVDRLLKAQRKEIIEELVNFIYKLEPKEEPLIDPDAEYNKPMGKEIKVEDMF